jgi:hypothetical protein
MWLRQFKIALVQRDSDTINTLLDEMPKFTEVSQMKEAQFLLTQASDFISELQDETAHSMAQLKKNSNYLRSTNSDISKLNIST